MRAALGGAAIAVAYPLWAPDSPVSAIGDDHDNLRYVSITRDNVVQNVTAAGTLEAVDTVEVSSQLSGQVAKLMADHNSRVRAGEPLAALDSATFEVLLKEAEAALAVALAQQEEANAAIEGAQAHYDDALRELQIKAALSKNGSVSQRDAERAQMTARALAAELSAAKAREQVRTAGVMAARASLERARLDLERSTIKSPIYGVVIRRSVELGQTLAASLQVLEAQKFLVARMMELSGRATHPEEFRSDGNEAGSGKQEADNKACRDYDQNAECLSWSGSPRHRGGGCRCACARQLPMNMRPPRLPRLFPGTSALAGVPSHGR